MMSKKRELGFTLIELLVVIGVLAIVASIAIPGFARWLPDYRLKSAARDLYSTLQLAKLSAVRQNATHAVVFHPGVSPGRYFMCSDNGGDVWDGPAAMGGNDVLERTGELSVHEGVDYGHGNATIPAGGAFHGDDISYTTPDNVAIFTPRGTVGGLGYVYLSNDRGTSYVVGTRSTAGAVVLRRWTGNGWE